MTHLGVGLLELLELPAEAIERRAAVGLVLLLNALETANLTVPGLQMGVVFTIGCYNGLCLCACL